MMMRMKKWMTAAGVWCAVSVLACGCGSADQPKDAVQAEEQEEENKTAPAEEEERADTELPAEKDTETPDTETPVSEDLTEEPNLTGNIKEIGDRQCTVTEVIEEEMEDGGEIMVSVAGGGDDPAFDKITVVWEQDTVFVLHTIYDGGARYEDADAKEEDLAADQMIKIWGTYEEGVLHASKIQIVKVVF